MVAICPRWVCWRPIVWVRVLALAGFSSFVLCAGEMAAPTFLKSSQAFPALMTRQVALGDLDADGDLDAVFANMGPNDSLVWLNDGTGRLADSGQRLTPQGHSVAVGDMDGDDDTDVFIACATYNDRPLPSRIYLNDGRGRFTDAGQDLGDGAMSGVEIRLFDVDGDGDLDSMVEYYPAGYQIYRNDGHGRFSDSHIRIDGVAFPGDLNRDGVIDFFIKDVGRGYRTLVNDGKGHFKKRWSLSTSQVRYGDLALGDIDGDGDGDAVVANGDRVTSYPTEVLLNDGTGRFSRSSQQLAQTITVKVALVDLDRDLSLDVVFSTDDYPIQVWLNDGTGMFADLGIRIRPAPNIFYPECSFGDIDRDGDMDIVIAAFAGGTNEIWFNTTNLKKDLAWLNGTWTGTVYQPGAGVQSYPTKLVANGSKNTYQVQYLTVQRKVAWTLVSGDDCQAMFLERTTSGLPSLATILLTKIRPSQTGSRYITWSRYLEDGSLDAWSALKKK